jgi:dTDP-glucose 4,6-dehydratase
MPPLPDEDLAHTFRHTADRWSALRGERVFITGGTGFFGSWLLETFAFANDRLRLGAQAVVLTRDPRAFAARMPHLASRGDLVLHAGDVRNFAFPPGSFSHVLHAATTSAFAIDPLENFDTIVSGTRRALDFAIAAGARKFLLTSSGAIYDALDPLLPSSTYGQAKRAAELLCTLYHQRHGLEVKIARCFAFAGAHLPLDQHFAIGNFIRDALAGGPIRVTGDGSPLRSYLDAADLAAWLWTLLFSDVRCDAFNVGSDHAVSIAELARRVAALAGGVPVEIAGTPAGAPPARYVPDISRARTVLGLDVWLDLDTAIRKMLAWHSSQP